MKTKSILVAASLLSAAICQAQFPLLINTTTNQIIGGVSFTGDSLLQGAAKINADATNFDLRITAVTTEFDDFLATNIPGVGPGAGNFIGSTNGNGVGITLGSNNVISGSTFTTAFSSAAGVGVNTNYIFSTTYFGHPDFTGEFVWTPTQVFDTTEPNGGYDGYTNLNGVGSGWYYLTNSTMLSDGYYHSNIWVQTYIGTASIANIVYASTNGNFPFVWQYPANWQTSGVAYFDTTNRTVIVPFNALAVNGSFPGGFNLNVNGSFNASSLAITGVPASQVIGLSLGFTLITNQLNVTVSNTNYWYDAGTYLGDGNGCYTNLTGIGVLVTPGFIDGSIGNYIIMNTFGLAVLCSNKAQVALPNTSFIGDTNVFTLYHSFPNLGASYFTWAPTAGGSYLNYQGPSATATYALSPPPQSLPPGILTVSNNFVTVSNQVNGGLMDFDSGNLASDGSGDIYQVGTLWQTNSNVYGDLSEAHGGALMLDDENPSAQMKIIFMCQGVPVGGVRSDFNGNFNWHAIGSQGHQFYNTIDGSDANCKSIGPNGFLFGQGAGSVANYPFESAPYGSDTFYTDTSGNTWWQGAMTSDNGAIYSDGSGNLTAQTFLPISDRARKENIQLFAPSNALQMALSLTNYTWRFKARTNWVAKITRVPNSVTTNGFILTTNLVAKVSPASGEEIGPMAQDWHAMTGLGGGTNISVTSMSGLLLGAVQGLAAQVNGAKEGSIGGNGQLNVPTIVVTNLTLTTTGAAPASTTPVVWFVVTNAGQLYKVPGCQ